MRTSQQVYVEACMHLQSQNTRSVIEMPGFRERGLNPYACAYRGLNGLKCVVGYFIPDAIYCKEMELHGVPNLIKFCEEKHIQLPEEIQANYILLDRLQRYHDLECFSTQGFGSIRCGLISVGEEHKLHIPMFMNQF